MFELILLAILVVFGIVGAASLMFVASILMGLINAITGLAVVILRICLWLVMAPFRVLRSVMISDDRVRR